jgi:addiction module HigA family antidote
MIVHIVGIAIMPSKNGRIAMMTKRVSSKLPPIHPGEILREDFMKPARLTAHRLAMALHVPATRIAEIIHERRAITADTAIRLGRYFKTTPRFWLNLQTAYDLEIDLEIIEDEALAQIERGVRAGVKRPFPVHPLILPCRW